MPVKHDMYLAAAALVLATSGQSGGRPELDCSSAARRWCRSTSTSSSADCVQAGRYGAQVVAGSASTSTPSSARRICEVSPHPGRQQISALASRSWPLIYSTANRTFGESSTTTTPWEHGAHSRT